MPDLAQLQADMARGLLGGRFDAVTPFVLSGPVTAAEALRLHRNTALHGLVNALRLSHPTVDALVGEAFFDQAALAFIAAAPPRGAWLTGYGESFADFLAAYAPAADLPYLADSARLDFAIEAAGSRGLGETGARLDLGEAILALDGSLALLDLDHPAMALRDALAEGDEALAALDMTPRLHTLALWRLEDGAGVRALAPASALFLRALLTGGDLEAALADGADLAAVQLDIFAAPFARLTPAERPLP